jgi:hypothetical protein
MTINEESTIVYSVIRTSNNSLEKWKTPLSSDEALALDRENERLRAQIEASLDMGDLASALEITR